MKSFFASLVLISLLSALTPPVALGQRPAADPNLLAAESYMRRQNYAKALEALDLVFRFNSPPPEAFLMLAACHFNLGEKDKAVDALKRGIAAYPAAPSLAEQYVVLLPTAVGKDEVKSRLTGQLRRQPQSAIYRKALARLALDLEPSGAETERILAETIKLLPRDSEAHFLYGQWACLNKRHALCIAELKKALVLAPMNNQARMQSYTLMAMAEDELGRAAPAEEAFRKALAANRRLAQPSPHAAIRFVEFLAQRNRDEEAQRLVDEILKHVPNFGPAWFTRAKYLARRQRFDKAIEAGEFALKYADGNAAHLLSLHAFMAKTYFAAGRSDDARVHQDWIEKQPKPLRN